MTLYVQYIGANCTRAVQDFCYLSQSYEGLTSAVGTVQSRASSIMSRVSMIRKANWAEDGRGRFSIGKASLVLTMPVGAVLPGLSIF